MKRTYPFPNERRRRNYFEEDEEGDCFELIKNEIIDFEINRLRYEERKLYYEMLACL